MEDGFRRQRAGRVCLPGLRAHLAADAGALILGEMEKEYVCR